MTDASKGFKHESTSEISPQATRKKKGKIEKLNQDDWQLPMPCRFPQEWWGKGAENRRHLAIVVTTWSTLSAMHLRFNTHTQGLNGQKHKELAEGKHNSLGSVALTVVVASFHRLSKHDDDRESPQEQERPS